MLQFDAAYNGSLDGAFEVPACASFNLRLIARWWAALRSRPPFLPRSLLPEHPSQWRQRQYTAALKVAIRRKNWDPALFPGHLPEERRHKLGVDAVYYDAFASWLHSSPSAALASSYQAQAFPTCAVVGSGHDLRCGEARGAQIDAHDAVFRSNAAQPASTLRGLGEMQMRQLQRQYGIDGARAGRRTSFRVNCIYGDQVPLPMASGDASAATPVTPDGLAAVNATSASEVCIIPRSWFLQRWGREAASSTRHVCCDEHLVRSSYNVTRLMAHEHAGARFAFHTGAESGDEAVDAMLAGSGGNALQAALSLCEQVDVYGAGLHSKGVGHDKIYAHAYDEAVGRCMAPMRGPGARPFRFGKVKGMLGLFGWRRDRVRTEMLMHVLHALGVIHWVQ